MHNPLFVLFLVCGVSCLFETDRYQVDDSKFQGVHTKWYFLSKDFMVAVVTFLSVLICVLVCLSPFLLLHCGCADYFAL